MATKISVIIPVYNVEEYIEKCLRSVLAQTFLEFEIIVVDDGSTDRTPEVCDEIAKQDSRLTVIHKKNEGVSIARNLGIRRAKGDFFLFFDGDDFVEPECMEELYRIAVEKKADTILYGYYRYEAEQVKEVCLPRFSKVFYKNDQIITKVLPQFIGLSNGNVNGWICGEQGALYVENPALWRAMVSGTLIRDNHIEFDPTLTVGEDTIFISEYLTYAKRCFIHQKPYYYLVSRQDSTISNYERNPLSKLKGKTNLLESRKKLTERVLQRTGIDITSMWTGTVVMSCMELAVLLTKERTNLSFKERYHLYLGYVKDPLVQTIIKRFRVKHGRGIRGVPFHLLKMRWYAVLFSALQAASRMNYQFNRS